MRLEEKVAIITGAGQGIGEAYARAFTSEGARVAVADINREKGEAVAESLRNEGADALFVHVDISDENSCHEMAQTVVDQWGRIDATIANAAIYYDIDNSNHSLEYLKKIFDVNYFGTWLTLRAAYRHMRRQGSGSLITQSSDAAYLRFPVPHEGDLPSFHYGITKASISALTHFVAAAAGPHGVRCNAISPGPTMTEATRNAVPEATINGIVQGMMAIKRPLETGDLTGAAVYLASDESSMVTGQVLAVNGGLVMLG